MAHYLLFSFSLLGLLLNACNRSNQAMSMDNQELTPKQEKSALTTGSENFELATLGGGCFWCVEAIFQGLDGVHSVVSGYSGGKAENADYRLVCSGMTKHAEAVQVKFDPKVISYEEILEVFWNTHDPTTLNRQGNDIGPQYRSVIFYHNDAQKRIAKSYKKDVATTVWDDTIVTEISPFRTFYEAEDYHQDYYETVGSRNSYCTMVITPKMKKFQKQFKDKLRKVE
ncbi:MAG: peptide-methionine (S)-S-oxide reductase MsrA [Bacteroidetes bacterium]|nr:peptide-methionine (S)-S-oxide reductase MsrA [Bacteroidota bacterium]